MKYLLNVVILMLISGRCCMILPSHIREEKESKEKEACTKVQQDEARKKEGAVNDGKLKLTDEPLTLLGMDPIAGEESLDAILASMDEPLFAGYDSLVAMRNAVEHAMTAENKLTTQVAIPVTQVITLLSDYLSLCEKQQRGKGFFVEKQYIGQRKILSVGDLHGSISALLDILDDWVSQGYLYDNYVLAPDVHVVFLGDYVDRGEGGIEVLCMLLRLKINNWSQVTIIRGNHEDWNINETMGFEAELANKYPGHLYQFRADKTRPQDSLIPRVYETFPLAVFLAGGQSSSSENLSYALCLHGMLDEALCKATAEILKKDFPRDHKGETKITWQNSESRHYVSFEVMWGDLQQYIDSEQYLEAPTRKKVEKTGRVCANQAWLEENFSNRYPEVKVILRGHQHAITDGVLCNVATWTDLQRSFPEFHKKNKSFYFPYPRGPFSAVSLEALCKSYYEERYAFDKCWGKVITTSAAKDIDSKLPINKLRYLFLLPGVTSKDPWEIRIEEKGGKPFVISAPKKQTQVVRRDSGRSTLSSESSSSAMSSSAQVLLSERNETQAVTSGTA